MWENIKQWIARIFATELSVRVSIQQGKPRKQRRFLIPKEVVAIEYLLGEGRCTQEEIAQQFDVSRSVVSKIKHGKHRHSYTCTTEMNDVNSNKGD